MAGDFGFHFTGADMRPFLGGLLITRLRVKMCNLCIGVHEICMQFAWGFDNLLPVMIASAGSRESLNYWRISNFPVTGNSNF